MESPFFFENKGYNIFGILHSPSKRHINAGFVLCYPAVFEGPSDFYRQIYATFARKLASIGYYILRFNYMGTGDSAGNFEDATVESRVSDIMRAIVLLKEKSGIRRIGLLGMGLGATWAGLAAVESTIRVDPLIFWEPVVDAEKLFDINFRQAIALQNVLFHEILFDRKQIVESIISNGSAEYDGYQLNAINGYPISRSFYIQSINVDLPTYIRRYAGNMLIIQIDRNILPYRNELMDLANSCRHDGKSIDLLRIKEPIPWWTLGSEKRILEPVQLLDVTENWINKIMDLVSAADGV
jgi:hypothetical protein